ncbi:hypothetical protein ACX35O_002546 [Enterococcus faecalis]|uniref:hypothetical protein n=1 Tax=Enterococcus faecalis TaxID=1351 RepID=UPI003DD4E276
MKKLALGSLLLVALGVKRYVFFVSIYYFFSLFALIHYIFGYGKIAINKKYIRF